MSPTIRYGRRHPDDDRKVRCMLKLVSQPIAPRCFEHILVRPEYATNIDFYERGPSVTRAGLFYVSRIFIGVILQPLNGDAHTLEIKRDIAPLDTLQPHHDLTFVVQNTSDEVRVFEAELSGWTVVL